MSFGSVKVTGGQSSQVRAWQLQGRAPDGEAALLTAVVVAVDNISSWGQACSVVWGIFPRSLASISFLQPSL